MDTEVDIPSQDYSNVQVYDYKEIKIEEKFYYRVQSLKMKNAFNLNGHKAVSFIPKVVKTPRKC